LVERAPEKREVTGSTPVPTTWKSPFSRVVRLAPGFMGLNVVPSSQLVVLVTRTGLEMASEQIHFILVGHLTW
jgi:hypothetical protein